MKKFLTASLALFLLLGAAGYGEGPAPAGTAEIRMDSQQSSETRHLSDPELQVLTQAQLFLLGYE